MPVFAVVITCLFACTQPIVVEFKTPQACELFAKTATAATIGMGKGDTTVSCWARATGTLILSTHNGVPQ